MVCLCKFADPCEKKSGPPRTLEAGPKKNDRRSRWQNRRYATEPFRLAEVNGFTGILIQKQHAIAIIVEVMVRIVEIKHAVERPGLEVV